MVHPSVAIGEGERRADGFGLSARGYAEPAGSTVPQNNPTLDPRTPGH